MFMTLDQLDVILAIVETGSFRAAAEKLNRSQPALSTAVKNLESEFDIRIFDRETYRPTLTPAGEAFVLSAKETRQAADLTARLARELGTGRAETRVRVSVDALVSLEFIRQLTDVCATASIPPALILENSIFDSGATRLLEGQVDLAIGPRSKSADVEAVPLESVTMIAAISPRLTNAGKRPTRAQLKDVPQVFAYDLDPGDAAIERQRKIFVPDHQTKVKLIENGIGWGRISKKEFQAAGDLIKLDQVLDDETSDLTLELALMRARRRPLGPVARNIWNRFADRKPTRS